MSADAIWLGSRALGWVASPARIPRMRLALLGALLLAAMIPSPIHAQAGQPPEAPGVQPVPPAATQGIDIGPLKNLKFSGVLQVWYQGGDQGFADTFRLRRLRLYVGGQVARRAKFMVMLDPARALVISFLGYAGGGSRTHVLLPFLQPSASALGFG